MHFQLSARTRQRAFFCALALVLLPSAPSNSPAQAFAASARDTTPSKTFFTKKDLVYSAVALAGSAVLSAFDLRIRDWSQSPHVQGSQQRQDNIEKFTHVNELPLTLAALGTYGVGRISSSNTITDVGLHFTEAMVLTVAVSEIIRVPVGRTRPRSSPDNQYDFHFGGGFSHFDERSFPSLHASAAFAAASVLSGELKLRKPDAAKYVAPVLYTAAMVPGLTRIYLDQHWASDIVSGAFVGALLGSRVVQYAHAHKQTRFDRWMMGVNVVPSGDGGVLVLVNTQR
jgi:membrane-associated phospholipid phosphatase